MDSVTMANINLLSVLSNLPALCEMDEAARGMVGGERLTMQLAVKDGEAAHLIFSGDSCAFFRGKTQKPDIALSFRDADHVNAMFDGKKNPGITKGLSKIGFLTKNFTALTDRLAYFLRPAEGLADDPEFRRINTCLTFHTAFFALCEIANSDQIGRVIAGGTPVGVINVTIEGGPAIHITVGEDHRFLPAEGAAEQWRAQMRFFSLPAAAAILNGEEDIYTGLGKGEFAVSGYIPMVDDLGRMLNLVEAYLR